MTATELATVALAFSSMIMPAQTVPARGRLAGVGGWLPGVRDPTPAKAVSHDTSRRPYRLAALASTTLRPGRAHVPRLGQSVADPHHPPTIPDSPSRRQMPRKIVKSTLEYSLGVDGNNLADRLAEGIVTKLPGWPADRSLIIVERNAGGGWSSVRTYPALGDGKPVRLYLRADGVYIAIAEEGSPFGGGAEITMPWKEPELGNSFYIALQKALFPDQREAMGIERWNENDVDALRQKVGAFAQAQDNASDMAAFFRQAWADGGWRRGIREGLEQRRVPPVTARPAARTPEPLPARALDQTRTERIGTINSPRQFVCHLYIHDDVSLSDDDIVRDYAKWWLEEMRALLPDGTGLQLNLARHRKGFTDIDYVAITPESADTALLGFNNKIADGMLRKTHPLPTHEYHVLVTGKNPDPNAHGRALPSSRVAIASLDRKTTIGHELGHLFGATHEAGKVEYSSGWWCDTVMNERGFLGFMRASCDRFSPANRENIRNALARAARRRWG